MSDEPVAGFRPSELAKPASGEEFRYHANAREDGRGALIAEGNAPTSGNRFFFCPIVSGSPWPVVSPARFELRMICPTGAVDVERTPFRLTQLLIAVKPGATITVTDGGGDHPVTIMEER